ncbi:hypothetical protein GPECTOR_2g1370 [Gonium pectorale]|uniref:General transcription and DNA repair factor IIH subunit TFB5 n=1 Tax=Gonium pectorale TaxID=33097 RepID=A0A150H115_GONPE|nr:hypothetical protein GPECTOR_2g1370 [Gonium pectorale]|eukprot:KXZ55819.1 hypothetical protein GPECTOR_2g1370 [Gonium pectorale]
MVSAKKGTLLRWKKEFIIADLDDRTLLVNSAYVDEIRAALKKYSDELTFEPSEKLPGQQ